MILYIRMLRKQFYLRIANMFSLSQILGVFFDILPSPNTEFIFVKTSKLENWERILSKKFITLFIENRNIIYVRPENANEGALLQAARWSTNGGDLVFVYKDNVYFMAEGFVTVNRVTENTDKYIYNGIPDWIYEEEILAVSTAFWFNAEGSKLAYAQFNDTGVDIQEYPWYGDTIDDSNVYLERVEIKYPKVSY